MCSYLCFLHSETLKTRKEPPFISRIGHFQQTYFTFVSIHKFQFNLDTVAGTLISAALHSLSLVTYGIYRDVMCYQILRDLYSFCTDAD